MISAVACGMEDEDSGNIDSLYALHEFRNKLEGMEGISEFEYINRVVIRDSPINSPQKYI